MIVSKVISCGVCKACTISATKEDFPKDFGGNATRRFVYVYGADAHVFHDTESTRFAAKTGDFIDFRGAVDQAKTIIELHSEACFWIAFYMENAEDPLDAELLHPGGHELSLSGEEESVFCLKGSVWANGKELKSFQFAFVPDNRKTHVSVPDGSLAIRLSKGKA